MVVCPHCNFVMDPLDKECSKCRGNGRVASLPSPPVAATSPAVAAKKRSDLRFSLSHLVAASGVMFLLGFVASRSHYRGRIHELYSKYTLQLKNRLKPSTPKTKMAVPIIPSIPTTRTITYVVAAAPHSITKEAAISYKDPQGRIVRSQIDPPLPLPWSLTYGMPNGTTAWLLASGVKGNVSVEVWQDGKLMNSAVTTNQTVSVDCTVKVGQAEKTSFK